VDSRQLAKALQIIGESSMDFRELAKV